MHISFGKLNIIYYLLIVGRGVMLTTHPHLVPRSRKRGATPPLTPSAYMAYSGTNFNFLIKTQVFTATVPGERSK
jgi:hypothetical protein